ncbi:MAG: nucleotide sugar dehydrogenase [Wenyingzhuangia sp.]|uniref:nucleotide sugar dehydrogenase n=1 Tax=Wenyingzhuangia sp. TaxID=1964193 RepID=UPI00321BC9B4
MKINKICCIGAGYVGGPTMAVIALKCPDIKVTAVDLNATRIAAWNGPLDQLPIYEPGLAEVVGEARGRNLFFSTDIDQAIDEAQMIFMAVNTPTKTEGEGAGMAADLRYFISSAEHIAKVAKDNKIVVEKSTLPVRTAEKIKEILNKNQKEARFEILSNPEFLAEGTAIQDLFKSDRVLVGGDATPTGQEAVQALVDIYANWIPKEKILTTNVWSSELAKLASNAMLAQRISSINSLSALCEKTGADIDELSKAVGMDHRIGPHFLKASVGFGGSCFQKDILNLVYLCKHYGLDEVAEYWHQVVKINDYQKKRFAQKIINSLNGDIQGKKITLLGWAFKKNTNDTRESAAIYVADILIAEGGEVHVFDPMVKKDRIHQDLTLLWEARNLSKKEVESKLKRCVVHADSREALENTFAIAILTEWDEFKCYDWEVITKKTIQPAKIFDGRNIMSKKESINQYSIGK